MKNKINIALVGNPNTGKTSLFNQLTGLNQKVGNYPGVTVDKKQGNCKLPNGKNAIITDLPGTYSINPTSLDESVVLKALSNPNDKFDAILVVAEVENLKRNLLLFSQVKDLEIPTILVINMADQMQRKGISIDIQQLKNELQSEVVLISARNNTQINEVTKVVAEVVAEAKTTVDNQILYKIDTDFFTQLQAISPKQPLYKLWLSVTQNHFSEDISATEKEQLRALQNKPHQIKQYQHKETIYRYQKINEQLKNTYTVDKSKANDLRAKLDRVFTHKILGYVIFFGLLALIFQSIFEWSSVPMDFIDAFFTDLTEVVKHLLPAGKFTDLLTEGIIAGVGGVVIFVPQIIILFLFIAILEETGYMSRVVFIMDKIMRKFGLSGKSIFPLISGTACAIPAVMAARTITNWKERLITILVTPFITCGARLPVYAVIIALIIPEEKVFGIFGLQGLTLLGLYALGFVVAVLSSWVLHKMMKKESKSFFVAEMPDYKIPSAKNVFYVVYDKTKTFVVDAGKIILAISIVLWFLGSHGGEKFDNAEKIVVENPQNQNLSEIEKAQLISSTKLENSYIGVMGKAIEPVVKPLGYDWKIGIGLITSFAAREVFVGTLSTIYSVEEVEEEDNSKFEYFANVKEQWKGLFSDDEGEEEDENSTIKSRMQNEINQETGEKRFNFATGMSLLLFYAFAMQCMATLAIVKRETKSWKWPLIQLFGMGALAYISALIAYQILK